MLKLIHFSVKAIGLVVQLPPAVVSQEGEIFFNQKHQKSEDHKNEKDARQK